jgi:hypothetical protein
MTEKLYFYSPNENSYYSRVHLWVVARKGVRPDGIHWLEPQWIGGNNEQGIALYTSQLDAAIAAIISNQQNTGELWTVYPFVDMNITEMMLDVKDFQSKYHAMLIFGFSIDDFRCLIHKSNSYCSVQYSVEFSIDDDLDPTDNYAIMKFSDQFFEGMNRYWHEEFDDYCAAMEKLNELPREVIERHAHDAVAIASVTSNPICTESSMYCLSTYSIDKGVWIVSSLPVSGKVSINKLH